MSNVAIRVDGLGKRYQIDPHREPYGSFRDSVANAFRGAGAFFSGNGHRSPSEEFWALRDVSFEVKYGEVMGIIGHNGAGKSTLLKILSRITEPTTGRVTVRGRVGALLEVGTGFHPELTGRENIYLNGAILGMKKAEITRKFDEIVAFAEVERFLDTPVKRYSSGMQLRLGFSVAAHLEPDILIVDEVLAVGDSAFQKKCLGRLRDVVTQEGRPVIFVSHNLQAVQALCTTASQFERGRLVDIGPVRTVIGNYLKALGSGASRREWGDNDPPPGNAQVRLIAIETSSGDNTTGVYSSSSEITVAMEFDVTHVSEDLCVGFDLVTPEGVTVLRTYQTDLPESEWPALRPGRNSWACVIPRGLLNGGSLYVSPRISLHNKLWIVNQEAAVGFEVVLDHGLSPYWNSLSASNRPGLVAPIFNWRTHSRDQVGCAPVAI